MSDILLRPDGIIENLENQVIRKIGNVFPTLGVIVSDNPNALEMLCIKSIKSLADKYGANIDVRMCRDVTDAYKAVKNLSYSPGTDGIVVLPSYTNDRFLLNSIPTVLDLDCLSANSIGAFECDMSDTFYRLAPCMSCSAYKVVEYFDIPVKGKRVTIVGKSLRTSLPIASIFLKKGAIIKVLDSNCSWSSYNDADIIVCSANNPCFLGKHAVSEDQVIIDVGFGIDDLGNVPGDVNLDEVAPILANGTGRIATIDGTIIPIAAELLMAKLFVNAAKMRNMMMLDTRGNIV